MAIKHRPQRSCVACRSKQDKRILTRLVFAEGTLTIDETGKMKGRGAYLCAGADCWRQAASGVILGKALRRGLSQGDREYLRQMKPS